MIDIADRLRKSVTKGHEPADEDAIEAADEIERLGTRIEELLDANGYTALALAKVQDEIERLREFNTKLCAEIDLLRDMVRDVMSELLIAQEDNQMTSSAYRGEWLGELIGLCQRGLGKP